MEQQEGSARQARRKIKRIMEFSVGRSCGEETKKPFVLQKSNMPASPDIAIEGATRLASRVTKCLQLRRPLAQRIKAARNNHGRCVDVLLEAGASSVVNDKKWRSAWYYACFGVRP